jgi:hypothetical protein
MKLKLLEVNRVMVRERFDTAFDRRCRVAWLLRFAFMLGVLLPPEPEPDPGELQVAA